MPTDAVLRTPDFADDAQLRAWTRQMDASFGTARPTEPDYERRRLRYSDMRMAAGFAGDRIVATFGSFDRELSLPPALDGQARTTSADLVTAVTVAATHRRRGLLSTWMRADLAAARERGQALAALVASEARIYGRYGFGPATEAVTWRVDCARAADLRRSRDAGPPAGVDEVALTDLAVFGPPLYEIARRRQPGAPPRSGYAWDLLMGVIEPPPGGHVRQVFAHSGSDGVVDGYALVRIDSVWDDRVAESTAVVEDMAALSPEVTRILWRFCLDLDLIAKVEAADRPVGEAVADMLPDRRAVRRAGHNDLFWLRVLDSPAALRARGWQAPGRVVLDVVDDAGLAGGRWLLDVDESGAATVAATDASPDLALGVAALASLMTGERSPVVLGAGGLIDEHSAGALARFDRMSSHRAPAHVTYQWF